MKFVYSLDNLILYISCIALGGAGAWVIYRIGGKIGLMDIANERTGAGIQVMGDNCARFMTTNRSSSVSREKVVAYMEGLPVLADEGIPSEIEKISRALGGHYKDFIRGHFIFSKVHRYISLAVERLRKRVSLSNEALYSVLLLAFESSFDESHEHYSHYRKEIQRVSSYQPLS